MERQEVKESQDKIKEALMQLINFNGESKQSQSAPFRLLRKKTFQREMLSELEKMLAEVD